MKLANMHDSKSCAERLEGSTPSSPTNKLLCLWQELKAGAMCRQQAAPRDGIATEPSDDEVRVVINSLLAH